MEIYEKNMKKLYYKQSGLLPINAQKPKIKFEHCKLQYQPFSVFAKSIKKSRPKNITMPSVIRRFNDIGMQFNK